MNPFATVLVLALVIAFGVCVWRCRPWFKNTKTCKCGKVTLMAGHCPCSTHLPTSGSELEKRRVRSYN